MREFVAESVRRDLERVRRGAAENEPAIKQARRAAARTPTVDRAGEQLAEAVPVAAVNEAQQRAIRQLTDPVREQLAALAEQAARAVRESQQQAVESATASLRDELAALSPKEQLRSASEQLVEQHRAALSEALGRVQQTYLDEIRKVQEMELMAVRRQLDPFARDWESEEDSVYDDVD
jgi:dGTP triphosphohydrolase